MGQEAEKYIFECLLESQEFKEVMSGSGKEKLQNSAKGQLFTQLISVAANNPHFLMFFPGILESVCPGNTNVAEYVAELGKALRLGLNHQLLIACCAVQTGTFEGVKFLKSKIEEYFSLGKPIILPDHLLSLILFYLSTIPELEEMKDQAFFLMETNPSCEKLAEFKGFYNNRSRTIFLDKELDDNKPCLKEWGNMQWVINIPDTFEEFLQNSVANASALTTFFSEFQTISDEDILKCVLVMCNNVGVKLDNKFIGYVLQSSKKDDWSKINQEEDKDTKTMIINPDHFVKAITDSIGTVKWINVLKNMDCKNLNFIDGKSFENFLKFFQKFKKSQSFVFPSNILFGKWKNVNSQMNFIKHLLLSGKPELVNLGEIGKNFAISKDINYYQQGKGWSPPSLQFWASVEFVEMLLEFSESSEYYPVIREHFSIPMSKFPDIILLSLAMAKPKGGGPLISEIFTSIFPLYLLNHVNSIPTLNEIWNFNKPLMITAICQLCKKEASSLNLSRVLDICQDLKESLIHLVNSDDFNFSVPLAILAAKRDFLHFEQWLHDRVNRCNPKLIEILLLYIDEQLIQPCALNRKNCDALLERSQFSLKILSIAFEILLMSCQDKVPQHLITYAQSLYSRACDFFPTLFGHNEGLTMEVEAQANKHFEKFYQGELSTKDFIDLLSKLKSSSNPIEKETFACIIQHFLHEVRDMTPFGTIESELSSDLYLKILQSKILGEKTHNLCLGIMKECLEQGPIRKLTLIMKIFELMLPTMNEYVEFVSSIFESDAIRDKFPELLEKIKEVFDSKGLPLEPWVKHGERIMQKLKKKKKVQKKDEVLEDTKELKRNIKPEIKPTEKEEKEPQVVSIEPSQEQIQKNTAALIASMTSQNHPKMNRPPEINFSNILEDLIYEEEKNDIPDEIQSRVIFLLNNASIKNIDETSMEIKKILTEESHLKWFSKIIVCRRAAHELMNQPNYLKMITKINDKRLTDFVIKDSYDFCWRILSNEKISGQSTEKSILKSLGSWIGQITLAQNKPIIHKYLNIKHLLFEGFDKSKLEIILPLVCKILEFSKDSVVFNKKNPWMLSLLSLLNEIYEKEEIKMTLRCEISLLFKSLDVRQNEISPSKLLSKEPSIKNDENTEMNILKIADLPNYITIDSAKLGHYEGMGINLKLIVASALEKALLEILEPVIKRSVSIALITTKHLALKDFALEPDERKVLRGTHFIARKLSESLALITSREPLKLAMMRNLKEKLTTMRLPDDDINAIINSASQDNLDVGCGLIKKAVVERTLEIVNQDNVIFDELENRRSCRERGFSYYNENIYQKVQFLPDPLKPALGLSQEQLKIYEDFAPSSNVVTANKQKIELEASFEASKSNILEKIGILFNQIENRAFENVNYRDSVSNFIASLDYGDQFAPYISSKIYTSLLLAKDLDKISFLFYFLGLLKEKSSLFEQNQIKDLKIFFYKSDISFLERIEHSTLSVMLENRLMGLPDFEEIFEKFVAQLPTSTFTHTMIRTIQILVNKDRRLITEGFVKAIDLIQKISQKVQLPNDILTFIEDIKYGDIPVKNVSNVQGDAKNLLNIFNDIDSAFYLVSIKQFEEYLSLTTEEQISDFIKEFDSIVLGKDDEDLYRFFVFIIDFSIQKALSSIKPEDENSYNQFESMDFSYIDSSCKLATIILRLVISQNKSKVLEQILEAFYVVMMKYHHNPRIKFNQRPFFKLMLNLIYDLHRPEYDFPERELQDFFLVFLSVFYKVNPSQFPGFSFAWLELISSRHFMPKVLEFENYWYYFHLLLKSLFSFFGILEKNGNLDNSSVQLLYKGTLRVMLILLNDFKDFLCKYSLSLIEDVPESFLQILDIILAAYPKDMKILNPTTIESIESLTDFKKFPDIFFRHQAPELMIIDRKLDVDLKKYLIDKNEEGFTNIIKKFQEAFLNPESEINALLNNFTFFLPYTLYLQYNSILEEQRFYDVKADSFNLLLKLLIQANYEMREKILKAIVNQLRYPNIITRYYINIVLLLFWEKKYEALQEQLTGIIFERLMVNKPHPWGLVYIFLTLIQEQKFDNKKFFKTEEFASKILEKVFNNIKYQ